MTKKKSSKAKNSPVSSDVSNVSSTVKKSVSLKGAVKPDSTRTANESASSNVVKKPIKPIARIKHGKSRKSRMLAALYQPRTTSKSAMVFRSASSTSVVKSVATDAVASSRGAVSRLVAGSQANQAELI